MLNRIFKLVLLGVFTLVIMLAVTSCRKVKDTVGVVLVKDSSGNAVSNARVVLHSNTLNLPIFEYNPDNYPDRSLDDLIEDNMNIDNEYYPQYSDIFEADWTDGNGRAEFTLPFGMILNISVLKTDGNDEHLAAGVINIQKEKTTSRTVRLISY